MVNLVRNGPRHAAAVPQLLVCGIHDGTDVLLAQVAVAGLKQHRASHVAGAHLKGAPRHSDKKEEGRRTGGRNSRRKNVERRRSAPPPFLTIAAARGSVITGRAVTSIRNRPYPLALRVPARSVPGRSQRLRAKTPLDAASRHSRRERRMAPMSPSSTPRPIASVKGTPSPEQGSDASSSATLVTRCHASAHGLAPAPTFACCPLPA